MEKYQDVELVIRVKLPDQHTSMIMDVEKAKYKISSMDDRCERERSDAIFAVKPPGYEVNWETKENPWPIDKEGYTWVRLKCTDKTIALNHWKQEACDAIMALVRLKENIRKINKE